MQKSANQFTPLREFMHIRNTLCPYSMPTSVAANLEAPRLLKGKLKARRTSYLMQAFSKALKKQPRLNASFIKPKWYQRHGNLMELPQVNGTVSIDRVFGNERFPFSYVLENSDRLTLKEIDEQLDFAIRADVEDVPQFKQFLRLLKLPSFLRKAIMANSVNDPQKLVSRIGSFDLTNIGKWNLVSAALPCQRMVIVIGAADGTKLPISYSFNHIAADGAQIGEFHVDAQKIIHEHDFK